MSARLVAAVVIEAMLVPTFVTLVSLAATKFIFALFALTAFIFAEFELTADIAELIPAKNSNVIELAIRKIFANPETYQLKADAGRTHIIENFDWQKIAMLYEDLIFKTIDEFKC